MGYMLSPDDNGNRVDRSSAAKELDAGATLSAMEALMF
jgi:hypothetical protein